MKILYLISAMYNSAGMERTVANKANYFASKGHEVTIVTTDQSDREYFYDISPSVKKIDLDINFSEDNDKNILVRTLLFFKKNALLEKKLAVFLRENKQDIFVSLILKSSDFLYRLNDGSVKVVEHHFSRKHYFLQGAAYGRSLIEKIAYFYRDKKVVKNLKKIDCFVVLTHEDEQDWSRDLHNVVVIPNSISYDRESQGALISKKIVTIGRLDYQKGYDLLIPIWKEVALKHPDWKLLIYGSGDLKPLLLELISLNEVTESVILQGTVRDVQQALLDASIYVLPSRFEGLPMVLLESMSLGLPSVAFKCKCGPSDVIDDGNNGFLVDCFNQDDFADKINRLIEDFELRKKLGKNAKQTMAAYSHDIVCKQWERLFQDLINKKNSTSN